MLFNLDDSKFFESYKERNLYYKFFAGYFFNEFVEGYKERLDGFLKLVAKKSISPTKVTDVHVSFDNHESQFKAKQEGHDRGEFADVLIQMGGMAISIEVKYLSRINTGKDIIQEDKRIDRVSEIFKKEYGCGLKRCLLVRKTQNSRSPVIPVIIWDELLECIPNGDADGVKVKEYMKSMLAKSIQSSKV